MKLLIITVLIMMLIWQGCHSFFPVGESQKINLNDYDAEDIKLDLVDGTEITSKAYLHRLVTEPSNFIIGIGTLTYEGQENNKKVFYSYKANEFDSVGIPKIKKGNYAICYLKNGCQINYADDSYLRVKPQDGTGYFIMGEVNKDGIKNIKTSRVELNQIQNIEIKKVDGLKTAGTIILTLGVLSGLFLYALGKSLHPRIFEHH